MAWIFGERFGDNYFHGTFVLQARHCAAQDQRDAGMINTDGMIQRENMELRERVAQLQSQLRLIL